MDKTAYLEDIPAMVLHLLEEWGYTYQDVNARDIVNICKYLLQRLRDTEADDYYANLKETDYKQYLNVTTECIYFLYHYKDHPQTAIIGKLQEDTREDKA